MPGPRPDGDSREILGVGLIGAGPVTQAVHLPTLARLDSMFRVAAIMDVDRTLASSVSDQLGAYAATTVDELLANPAVDVVAICSPNRFHADQVIAACLAGKRAVLCEKPFAVDLNQADELATVIAETGVPVIVGAMHAFDEGWTAVLEAWKDRTPEFIRSSIVLPPNERFEVLATELVTAVAPTPSVAFGIDADVEKVLGGVLGLAIHDLPLIRRLAASSERPRVRSVRVLEPFGYLIILELGELIIELHAAMTENWEPSWVLEAIAGDAELSVHFTPSYVHAGSATAVLQTAQDVSVFSPGLRNGYEMEWEALYRAALEGGRPDAGPLVEDLRFALAIADDAELLLRDEAAITLEVVA
ncbi:Gfo/Idh/MocA family oxidoreductase [Planctomonas sp. JC2975]|nr:Gfo/Idh/MocA family oxidoreductase [Planctomonas sp. JC2975]